MRRPAHPRLLVAVLAVLAGCVTPSIPIPPPSPEQMVFELDVDLGTGVFEYPAEDNYAGAIVYVFNRSEGTGIITTARADGSVGPTEPFPAAENDEIAVTFETDEGLASTCVVLRATGPRPECN